MNDETIKYKHIPAVSRQINKTILMYHGWGSTVDSQLTLGEKLTELGFEIIIPELIYHDSRQPLDNHFQKDVMQNYFWKTIYKSIDEGIYLLELLGLVKEDTILLGSSMGGFITSGIFSSNSGFAGLININGSGSFIVSETVFREMDSRQSLNQEEIKQFKQYDPVYKELTSKNPILLMHGVADQVIPITGQKDYYSHLLKSNSEFPIQFQMYKEVNHAFTNMMEKDLIDWLEKFYTTES